MVLAEGVEDDEREAPYDADSVALTVPVTDAVGVPLPDCEPVTEPDAV